MSALRALAASLAAARVARLATLPGYRAASGRQRLNAFRSGHSLNRGLRVDPAGRPFEELVSPLRGHAQ